MPALFRLLLLGFALWSSAAGAEQADPLSSPSWIHAQKSKRSDVIVQLNHNLQDGIGGGAAIQTPIHGTIILTGPATRLANLQHTGSWKIVGCSSSHRKEQTVLAYCSSTDPHQGCADIFLGGAKHTIVMLPNGCGASPFARVVSLKPTKRTLAKAVGKVTVFELKFDYDFKSIPYKKGDTHTQLHMEFSDIHNYTNAPGFGTTRSYANWLWGIGQLVEQDHQTLKVNKDFSLSLADMSQKCKGFTMDLKIHTKGNVAGQLNFGYYFSGTIIPPAIDKHYVYLNAHAKARAEVTLTGVADYIFKGIQIPVLPPISLPGLSYPGILDVGPYFEILAGLSGDISVAGTMVAKTGFSVSNIDISLGNGSSPHTSAKATDFASVKLSENLKVAAGLTVFLAPQVGVQVSVLSGIVDADVALRPTAGISAGGETTVVARRRAAKRSPKLKDPCVEVDGAVDLYWLAGGQLGPWGKSIQGHIWGAHKKLWGKCWKTSKNATMSNWEPLEHSALPARAPAFSQSMKCPAVAPFGN